LQTGLAKLEGLAHHIVCVTYKQYNAVVTLIEKMTEPILLSAIIAAHAQREGPLLPILNDVQSHFGHISEGSIRAIAEALNLTRAEVQGVVSFYHDYKTAPSVAKVKLCRAEACQARGVAALEVDETKVEAVYCLGLCAVGPAAMIGGKVHARLDQMTLDALVAAL
jgi:formate dehydrogenase subunit gamma